MDSVNILPDPESIRKAVQLETSGFRVVNKCQCLPKSLKLELVHAVQQERDMIGWKSRREERDLDITETDDTEEQVRDILKIVLDNTVEQQKLEFIIGLLRKIPDC